MKKRTIIVLAVVAALAAGILFPFLQAAHRMREYLRIANPHFAPYVKLFAGYNPIGENFYMTITDDSSMSIFLEYVDGGLIIDELRTQRYLMDHDLSTNTETEDGSRGSLLTYWKYDAPEEPMFALTIYGSISATDEEAVEKAMKARMQAHFEQLPDIVTNRLFRCLDYHQIDRTSYRIRVDIPEGADFPALLEQAEMTKEDF